MHKDIYEKLVAAARARRTTTYGDIAPLAGLDMENPDDRNILAGILGEISASEHNAGRHMLSAVVILKDQNMPGQGFFNLARDLGLYSGNDDLAFFSTELNRVFDSWREE